jgi:phosphate-selective porin OprO and OprP
LGAAPATAQQGAASAAGVGGSVAAGPGGPVAAGAPAPDQPPFTMNIGSRVQVRYSYLDPDGEDAIGSFGIRRVRLSLGGTAYQRFDYSVQLELAGASVRLIDANIRYRLAPLATIWIGQGKAPFGRQQLTSSGNLHMVDRAITDGRFAPGRQLGVMLLGQNTGRTFEYGAGVFNGQGINTSNPDMNYMYVGRAVWTPLGAYGPAESAFDWPTSPRVALGVAGLHNMVGQDDAETAVARLGLEGAFKIRGFNATSELYHERSSPAVGDRLETNGWYVQGGYLLPNRRHELAARYAVISPDTPTNTDVVEMGIGHSLYFTGHRAKLQTDLRNVSRKATGVDDLELRVQFQLTL